MQVAAVEVERRVIPWFRRLWVDEETPQLKQSTGEDGAPEQDPEGGERIVSKEAHVALWLGASRGEGH